MHVGRKRLLDGLVAVAGFGDHFEIGLGVQNDPQTAQDDRVIVGDQDARLQAVSLGARESVGDGELDFGAAGGRRADGQTGADRASPARASRGCRSRRAAILARDRGRRR